MKKIHTLLMFLILPLCAVSQVDRTKAPEPGPAPEIKIGEYQSFELKNGLKVFVVENHKIPRVAFSLILDNKPILEGDKAGYISIAGQLLRHGTTSRTKAQLDEEVDFIGASLSTSSSGVFASSLTKHREKLLELMTDVLFNPAFPEEELEKIRKQTISGLAASKDDPNAIAGNVRTVMLYGKDHPYGELTTEETVQNIHLEDVKSYYKTYFRPNVAYLAIVGDITLKEAKKLVKQHFSKWERGEIKQPVYEQPEAPESTFVALVDRPSSVQSVINVAYPVELKPGSPDVIKARVLNQILGGGFSSRLMQNLREDKAFTYAAYSSLSPDEQVGRFIATASVRNEVTDSAVHELMHELKAMKQEEVTEEELTAAKAAIIGSFGRSLEQPSTIASFAINTARYNLPEDYYANYLKNVANTSIADVKEMADKYIRPQHSSIIVVGKGSEISEGLKKFGAVKYYDIYGNEYTPTATRALPEGLTAGQVIESYIQAIGGKDKVASVKAVRKVMKGEMMGSPIEMEVVQRVPGQLFLEISMGGNVMSKQVLSNNEAVATQMGNNIPVGDEDKEQLLIASYPFAEMAYEELGVKTELIGTEKVDGKDAYAVQVTYPSGKQVTHYFDVDSGLKVRQTEVRKGPEGEKAFSTLYKDYKEVNGIKFPHLIIQPVGGGMKLSLQAETIEVNPEVDEGIFRQ